VQQGHSVAAFGFVEIRSRDEDGYVFAKQGRVRLKQMPDSLGDNARLSRSRARNHEERSFTMRDRASLRLIQLRRTTFQRC
jgi:hypothetical protein